MATRDVYLKIEPIYGYSTVEPDMMAGPPRKYRRDCMRNAGHEDTSIPATEVEARLSTTDADATALHDD